MAVKDRRSIRGFIAQDNPVAALTLDEALSAAVVQINAHPGLGRLGRVQGTRELVVQPNYIVVYAQEQGGVRILRILHAARRWPT